MSGPRELGPGQRVSTTAERTTRPEELQAAVEQLAALVHEAWAAQRHRSGWHYGPVRDDRERTTPALVPYGELSESERDLDRVAVRATLDGLDKLGYRLEREAPAGTADERAGIIAQVDRLIERGLPLPAYDLTKRWLAAHPDDADLKLRNARALRRSGAQQRALAVLEELRDQPDDDGERRGLLAAVNKELFSRSFRRAEPRAVEFLRRAQRLYREVFDESNGVKYWHGINAATLAFAAGETETAREIAARVWAACEAEQGTRRDYWWLATRAEAALVLRRFELAASLYREALKAAGERIGDVASTRHNALMLLDAYGTELPERRAIEEALRPPAVVVFAGLPLDRDGAVASRFPAALEGPVREALAARLEHLRAGFAFSSAAPGSEILFVEAMLERPTNVVDIVLPWPREQFMETHVRSAGLEWQQRFAKLLGSDDLAPRVHHVVSASLGVGIDNPIYERFASQLLSGLARIHAETLGIEVTPLVVSDGRPGERDGADEISAIENNWKSIGIELAADNVIDLRAFTHRRAHNAALASRAARRTEPGGHGSGVKAILFADVEDYSKIPEGSLPAFIEYFIGGIASRLALRPYRPDNLRRVGDGLLMVFSSVRDAGLYALELVEWLALHSQPGADGETHWSRLGLPRAISMRVALHAGPVFECVDPLTHAPAFEGAHINYAARIEPVTPANHVFASEAFAALASSWPEPCDEFTCEYVGRTTLAKKAGEYPLYHLRRRA
jgi:tetratricopeptide (TPR) repeat protein